MVIKLKFNKEFYCGYSPERINPGDKVNTLTKIVKVTSGSNEKTAKKIYDLSKELNIDITCTTGLSANEDLTSTSEKIRKKFLKDVQDTATLFQ